MTRDEPTRIDKLDLLAYGDGCLDAERAAEVEAFLDSRPELAAKVHDFSRQNQELREQFARYLEEPLPRSIRDVLERERRPHRRTFAQVAAACVLMVATGLGGWWYGQSREKPSASLERFLDQAASYYQTPSMGAEAPEQAAATVGGGEPLSWLWNRISLELQAPDLREEGYHLVDQRRVFFDGVEGVSLSYQSKAGEVLTVFVKGRWQERAPRFEVVRSEEVSLAYWMNGPLVIAVAAPADEAYRLGRLAHKIHSALGRGAAEADPPLKIQPSGPGAAQEADLYEGADQLLQPAPTSLDPSALEHQPM